MVDQTLFPEIGNMPNSSLQKRRKLRIILESSHTSVMSRLEEMDLEICLVLKKCCCLSRKGITS